MNKMTASQDRLKFLLQKHPQDYSEGYHHKVQDGPTKSFLSEKPQLKLGEGKSRDHDCWMKEQYQFLNKIDAQKKEKYSKWLIQTFDDYYNNRKIDKWFTYDEVVEKVSKKPKDPTQPEKLYHKRDQFLEPDRNIVIRHNDTYDSSKQIRSNAKSFVTRQHKKIMRERVEASKLAAIDQVKHHFKMKAL